LDFGLSRGAQLKSVDGEVDTAGELKLLKNIREVRLDRPFRDRESVGDLLIARADGDQAADLALALSQPAKSGFVFRRARRMQGRQLVDELEHHLSPDPNLSLPDEPDRFEDEAGIGVPGAIPVRTILQRPDGGQASTIVRVVGLRERIVLRL